VLTELLLFLRQNTIDMADNYLEKKMEEYRSGVLSRPYARRVSLTGSRPGTVSFKIDPLRVLVTDASDDVGRAVVTRLREAGCRVAFACADDKAGRALSQATGSRFYPESAARDAVADLKKAWGGIDVLLIFGQPMSAGEICSGLSRVIVVGGDPVLPDLAGCGGPSVNAISTVRLTADNVAHLCLLLCLDDSAFIDGKVFD
jgi:hypothetical protein